MLTVEKAKKQSPNYSRRSSEHLEKLKTIQLAENLQMYKSSVSQIDSQHNLSFRTKIYEGDLELNTMLLEILEFEANAWKAMEKPNSESQ